MFGKGCILLGFHLLLAVLLGASDPSLASQSANPIRIGVIFSLSGAAASFGVLDRDGVLLAQEVINGRGGVKGRPIQLIIEDDASTPDKAVSLATKLITQDRVSAVIGATTGSSTLAMAPLFQRHQVPLVAPVSTLTVTEQNNPYVFRACITDRQAIQDTVLMLQRQFGQGKVALIHQDDAAARASSAYFRELAKTDKLKLNLVAEEQFGSTDTDMTPQLTRIRAKGPDVLAMIASTGAGPIAVKNTRQLGMTVPIVGSIGMARATTWQVAGAAAEDVVIPSLIDPNNPLPRQQEFMKQFKTKYPGRSPDKDPTLWDAISYDAVMLLARAVEAAGSDKPEAIKQGLENIKNYQGVSAIYSYGPQRRDGVGEDALVWMKVQGGRFVSYKGK